MFIINVDVVPFSSSSVRNRPVRAIHFSKTIRCFADSLPAVPFAGVLSLEHYSCAPQWANAQIVVALGTTFSAAATTALVTSTGITNNSRLADFSNIYLGLVRFRQCQPAKR